MLRVGTQRRTGVGGTLPGAMKFCGDTDCRPVRTPTTRSITLFRSAWVAPTTHPIFGPSHSKHRRGMECRSER